MISINLTVDSTHTSDNLEGVIKEYETYKFFQYLQQHGQAVKIDKYISHSRFQTEYCITWDLSGPHETIFCLKWPGTGRIHG